MSCAIPGIRRAADPGRSGAVTLRGMPALLPANPTLDPPRNLLHDLPAQLPEELFQTLVGTPQMRIERIVSRGHCSAEGFWYDQDEAEWVLLLKGAARLEFEDSLREMRPGDHVHIPAHQRHRVAWTAPDEETIWLAVFHTGVSAGGR